MNPSRYFPSGRRISAGAPRGGTFWGCRENGRFCRFWTVLVGAGPVFVDKNPWDRSGNSGAAGTVVRGAHEVSLRKIHHLLTTYDSALSSPVVKHASSWSYESKRAPKDALCGVAES